MIERIQKTFEEETEKMPNEWQEAVRSLDWGLISEEIGKKNFLDEIGIEDLQAEIALALLGTEQITDLKINIENNVAVSDETSTKITTELFEKVFEPITKKFIELIKNGLKDKKPNCEQNINFILSGGDYTYLIAPLITTNESETQGLSAIPIKKDDIYLEKITEEETQLKNNFHI